MKNQKNGNEPPLLVALIVLCYFIGIIGLIVYRYFL